MDFNERLQSLAGASGFAPLAFLFAFLAGAAHAVGPGHGKTLAAAYLVGDRGRLRDAVWLSGSVAVMHTISVLVVAIAWTFYSLSDLVHLTTLTTALQLAAGLLTVGTGVWLLQRHLRGRAGAGLHSHGGIVHSHHGPIESHTHPHEGHGADHTHDHPHEHGHHTHSHADHEHLPGRHDHPHGPHEHDHSHTPVPTISRNASPKRDAGSPGTIGRPGLMLLGAAGGLVPSPTAFLVLVTGFFTGHAAFALLLVITFGLGMALVLFGVGMLALGGSSLITRGAQSRAVLRWVTRVAPALAAVAITVVGVVITVVSVSGLTAA